VSDRVKASSIANFIFAGMLRESRPLDIVQRCQGKDRLVEPTTIISARICRSRTSHRLVRLADSHARSRRTAIRRSIDTFVDWMSFFQAPN